MLAFKLQSSILRMQCTLSPRIARQEAVSSWIPSCDSTPGPFCECEYSLPPAATDRLIGLRGLRRYAIVLTILRSQDPGAFADQMHDVLRSSSRAALAEDEMSTRFTYAQGSHVWRLRRHLYYIQYTLDHVKRAPVPSCGSRVAGTVST